MNILKEKLNGKLLTGVTLNNSQWCVSFSDGASFTFYTKIDIFLDLSDEDIIVKDVISENQFIIISFGLNSYIRIYLIEEYLDGVEYFVFIDFDGKYVVE